MSMNETQPASLPVIEIRHGSEQREYTLAGQGATIGRAQDNEIVLDDPFASRHHARLECADSGWQIIDLGSGNGTQLNAERINPNTPYQLRDGDRIQIGDFTLALALPDNGVDRTIVAQRGAGVETEETQVAAPPQKLTLAGRDKISIGRAADNDIPVPHPSVSRRHAQIVQRDGKYLIQDFGSTNGTFVNGERVPVEVPRLLNPGDVIRVGPVKFIVAPQTIEQVNEAGNLRLDALHLTQTTKQGRVLLHDISLSILPREFVALVGVSGAGKSTLLDALCGYRPAHQGTTLVNGVDLYHNFDAYRNEIGYVPQQDIIHKELTVWEALDYSARLRLPADTTAEERRQRVTEVLDTLGLSERKNVPIGSLSGGQLKRVSIGVELLTQPGLFYLDEATSGLDPGTESQLMHLLRKLADQGHTILLVTHATKNVMLCDKIVLLAKGGNLAFFGPPKEALEYFGVQEFDEIYPKLENERTPEDWAESYRRSPYHQKYVVGRLQDKYGPLPSIPAPVKAKKQAGQHRTPRQRVSFLRQLVILSQRNLTILMRDRAGWILMLLLAPVVGLINFVSFKKGVLDAQGGDGRQALIGLFLLAMNGVFIGSIGSMREIVKEGDIYRRERLVTLRIGPYVLSKVWVGVLLALYQATIFLAITRLGSGWPYDLTAGLQVYLTVFLIMLASMFLGLFISAVSKNQNMTPLLLIVVIIPQLVFGGALLRVKTFGVAGEILSPLTITKWSYEALVTISALGKDVANDACWVMPKEQRDALTEAQKNQQCTCMGANIFHKCQFPGILDNYNAAVDQPEPVEPAKPGDPPPAPVKPTPPADQSPAAQKQFQADMTTFTNSLDQFQKDLTAYQDRVKQYENSVETWRTQYQDWKENRQKAIGQAEAIIDRYNTDYGQTFNVDLPFNWGMLGVIIAVLFGLTLIIQKRKDIV